MSCFSTIILPNLRASFFPTTGSLTAAIPDSSFASVPIPLVFPSIATPISLYYPISPEFGTSALAVHNFVTTHSICAPAHVSTFRPPPFFEETYHECCHTRLEPREIIPITRPLVSFPHFVAIVGAGPAGLSLACLLQTYRQPFLIIDSKVSGDRSSKATGLHRNTLRLLGKIGLAGQITRQAIELSTNKMYVDGALVKTITFEQGDQANDKNLSIDQFSLEEILFSYLSPFSLVLGRKVVAFNQNEEGITIEMQDCATLAVERIRARYLVGADGAKSMIRRGIGSSFEGETTSETAFTFDAVPRFPEEGMSMHTTNGERLIVVPLPSGSCKFSGRITKMPLTEDSSSEYSSETRDVLTAIVKRRSRIIIDPASISGLSFYHTASRIASMFRDRRVFLIGDAAHIFFPAGGYGLNAAIEDAFALAWRLSLNEAKLCSVSVFDSFEAERRGNAIAIQIDSTQKKSSSENPLSHPKDEKEKQVYGQIGAHGNQQIVSERIEKILPLKFLQNVRRGRGSLFDFIHSNSGIHLIASTCSSVALARIRMLCEVLNHYSHIPFSLSHVCLRTCSFPEERESCFIANDEQFMDFVKKYPESVISIRPDNFASISEIHGTSRQVGPFIAPVI